MAMFPEKLIRQAMERLEKVIRESGLSEKQSRKWMSHLRGMIYVASTGEWFITSKTAQICREYADFFIERMGKRLKGSWRDNYVGHIGEKAFHLILQKFDIPCDYGEPILDWRGLKIADFNIPFLGWVEVKTADHDKEHVSINYGEWKGARLVVAFRLKDKKPTKVEILGFMTKEEVEAYPTQKEGRRKYWKIPVEDFMKKHSHFDLIFLLVLVRKKIYDLGQKEGLIDIQSLQKELQFLNKRKS
jgi:hypothetical protein